MSCRCEPLQSTKASWRDSVALFTQRPVFSSHQLHSPNILNFRGPNVSEISLANKVESTAYITICLFNLVTHFMSHPSSSGQFQFWRTAVRAGLHWSRFLSTVSQMTIIFDAVWTSSKSKNLRVCFTEQWGSDVFRPQFQLAGLVTQNLVVQRPKVENQSHEQTLLQQHQKKKSFSRCVVLSDFPDKENQINRPASLEVKVKSSGNEWEGDCWKGNLSVFLINTLEARWCCVAVVRAKFRKGIEKSS